MTDERLLTPLDMRVKDLIQAAIEMNAGITRLSLNNGAGDAFVSVFVVHGSDECREIEEAIATVETRWELRREIEGNG